MHRPLRTTAVVPAVCSAALIASLTAALPATASDMSRFHEQELSWSPCEEDHLSGLECADLEVPLDHADPTGETITVAISRATATGEARGVLFSNPGGPGIQGRDMPLDHDPENNVGRLGHLRVAESYDLIGMDPRGSGGSSPVMDCGEHGGPLLVPRPDEETYAEIIGHARATEEACHEGDEEVRPHVTTANVARDMDIARAALGEDVLNYLGFSYGTTLGAVYGTLFPEQLDRIVLDSAVHPDGTWRERYMQMAPAHTENVDRYTNWVAEHHDVYGLGTTAEEVHTALLETSDRLADSPREDVPGHGTVDQAHFDAIMGDFARYQQEWDESTEFVRRLVEDSPFPEDAVSAEPSEDTPAVGDSADEELNLFSYALLVTTLCETDWPTDPEVYRHDTDVAIAEHPFGPGSLWAVPNACSFRSYEPAEEPVEIDGVVLDHGLVVSAEYDAQTPHAGAVTMAERLGLGLVSVSDDGGHSLYGREGRDCVTDAVDAYLVDGAPAEDTACAGLATPDPRAPENA